MTVTLSGMNFVGLPTIVNQIADALAGQKPYSLVRIGDGENIVMAQEKVLSLEWISANVGWSHSSGYCGATLPNLELRDRMVKAVKQADMVGVFGGDDLTERIFTAFGIKPNSIFYAFDNLYMPMYKPFVDLIRKYPPLLVGNPAERFASYLHEKLGITVPGTIRINGYEELDSCIKEMAAIPHKWSLVSAGCNALVITDVMASEYGKVSIDFGHAPDNVMSPDFVDYWLAID